MRGHLVSKTIEDALYKNKPTNKDLKTFLASQKIKTLRWLCEKLRQQEIETTRYVLTCNW